MGILLRILQHLDLKDRGQAACVGYFWQQAVEPLAPALFHHASRGDAAAVEELLRRPAVRAALEVAHPPYSRTALHAAIHEGHAGVVALLIQAGADVEHGMKGGQTPLTAACVGSRPAGVVELLLAAGAKPSSAALYTASRHGNVSQVELLIGAGVLTGQAGVGYRAMIAAHDREAAGGTVAAALRAGGAAVALADVLQKKLAVLVPPAAGGDMAEVERLLLAGADVNARTPARNTAIMVAARSGMAEMVRLLAQKGAAIEGALGLAAGRGHYEVVDFLVATAMGDNNTVYELEQSMVEEFRDALYAARENGQLEVADFLGDYVVSYSEEEEEGGRYWTSESDSEDY